MRGWVIALIACSASLPLSAAQDFDGPIPVTKRSHPYLGAPWLAEPQDLASRGYIEQEFFIRGLANVYGYAPDRQVTVVATGAAYVTRVLVRRPTDPQRFSGRVVVELLNASGAADAAFFWPNSFDHLLDSGDAYVAVTAKPVAIERLKQFDRARYESLSWPNPVEPAKTCKDPGFNALFPGWSKPQTEDGLLWDITHRTGTLLRRSDPAGLMGGLPVEAVFLVGHSQSGSYVGTWARDFQQRLLLPDGRPVFDGFLQTGSAGLAMINQCTPALPYTDPHVRMQSAAPFIRVMTLTDFYDYAPMRSYQLRREDSDAPGDHFRLYEVAGAEHVSTEVRRFDARTSDRLAAGLQAHGRLDCVETIPSDFPLGLVFNVALEHLDAWRHGKPPPRAQRINMDRPGEPDARALVDSNGNVTGGMRTPAVDVPRAAYAGSSTPLQGKPDRGCLHQGHRKPFDAAQLAMLYPTPDAYPRRLRESVQALQAAGWLTERDARRLVSPATEPGITHQE